MARELDYKCKMCRREGIKLFLKGSRCDSPKCAIERRDQAPGMHTRRGKPSEYAIRLREKQKLKRFYGVLERQFRRYFELASRSPENTGEQLLTIMERRLDNIVHRLAFAPNRTSARQMVAHGHILLNGRKCDVPSALGLPGQPPAEADPAVTPMVSTLAQSMAHGRARRLIEALIIMHNRDAFRGNRWLRGGP